MEKSTSIIPNEEKINTLFDLISKGSSQNTEQMLQLLSEIKDNTDIPSNLEKSTENVSEVIMKSVNEESRLALFVALPIKDEALDEYDLHQDSYSEDEVRKAMLSYNEHCMKAGVYHLYETQDAVVTQSYLAPIDMNIEDANGDERVIKAGSWLQEWFFPETDVGEVLWNKVKDGELTGISVQCNCVVEDINE